MKCKITELRYPLNGVTETQLTMLFELLKSEEEQVIFKRLMHPRYSISGDDLVFKGEFSNSLISTLSKVFPAPLALKIRQENIDRDIFRLMSCRQWVSDHSTIYAGNSILPNSNMMQRFGFASPEHMLQAILSTPLGSYIKSYLITKPKGLIEVEEGKIFMILPLHRLDFTLSWINQVLSGVVTIDWLNGTSTDLDEELIGTTGDLDINHDVSTWVEQSRTGNEVELNKAFQVSLRIIE